MVAWLYYSLGLKKISSLIWARKRGDPFDVYVCRIAMRVVVQGDALDTHLEKGVTLQQGDWRVRSNGDAKWPCP
jgi:hypothetical protein